MADHIAFVNGTADCDLVSRYYSDSTIVRVPLERAERLIPQLPEGMRIWVDAGIDGFHRPYVDSPNRTWKAHVRQFPAYSRIDSPAFHSKPDSGEVNDFVFAVLDKCVGLNSKLNDHDFKLAAISVPQLPIVNNVTRNKMNRALAMAAGTWKSEKKYRGRMILPAIFTDQKQLNLKTERNKKRDVLVSCYEKSEADGLWAVDSSLQDQAGTSTFRSKRFPGLLKFHEEISDSLPDKAITIAGPYWGMNLVLWVKELCRFPAIGVGGAYQYHLAGGHQRQASLRLALPPLRRWVRVGAGLQSWLKKAVSEISSGEAAHADISYLRDNYSTLKNNKPLCREQIAKFYKNWFDEIEASPTAGRALALYQMLSSAYVLGKALPILSSNEGSARRPERVVEYLMLNCL